MSFLQPEAARSGQSRSHSHSRSRSRSRSHSRRPNSDSGGAKHKKHTSQHGINIISDNPGDESPRTSSGVPPYPIYTDQRIPDSFVRPPSPPGPAYYSRHDVEYSNVQYTTSGGAALGPSPDTAKSHSGSVADSIAQFLPAKYGAQLIGGSVEKHKWKRDKERKKKEKKDRLEDDLAYGNFSMSEQESSDDEVENSHEKFKTGPGYAHHKKYEYAKPPEHIRHTKDGEANKEAPPIPPRHGHYPGPENGYGYSDTLKDEKKRHRQYSSSKRDHKYSYDGSRIPSAAIDPRQSQHSGLTGEPDKKNRREPSHERRRRKDSPDYQKSRRDSSSHRKRRESSSQPPTNRMSFLTVQTPHNTASLSLSSAPPSPLLEAYQGTYQNMSPMPSPILGPQGDINDMDMPYPGLPPGGKSDSESDTDDDAQSPSSLRRFRRARFHDPSDDAMRIAKALKGDKEPEVEPLLEILPGMTHSQVIELRAEYKRIVKTGSEKKGVNVAKHIRSRLKDSDPHLMKACYTTALGRWESEAYWANFWYQGDKTRRELLIEALFGRTNAEIHDINQGFSDKKYSNSLARCMEAELKEDKFKKCVMMVLKEERDEGWDYRYNRPVTVDAEKVNEDVYDLRKALKKGSESSIYKIVLTRSDVHLKQVLKVYEKKYESNLAREVIKNSGNLVGEVIAHVINGVINKPLRDAMLIHQAVNLSRRDELRRELLTSRLVRYHWDRDHMKAVKWYYRERYGREMRSAVREAGGGTDWGHFCEQLCISRIPGSVKRFETKVEIIGESGESGSRR